jgi:HPt (histidine-containing phosphotransfer) domain-containing protein
MSCNKIKFCDLDTSTPIDIEAAIQGLGDDPDIFYLMLGNLESMSLNGCLRDIIPVFESRDYDKIKHYAHSLKGASAYIGASRLHYMCFFIQQHWVDENYEKMLEYYPSLVEAAIEFKVHSRKLMAQNRGKFHP